VSALKKGPEISDKSVASIFVIEEHMFYFKHRGIMPLINCLVHRLRKISFLTGAQDSHLQRVTIPEAAYCIYNYNVDLLMMSRAMLETCRGF
jgi:hypothetical protein